MKAIVLVNRILCLLLIVSFLGACNEGLDDSIKEDPYKGGKTPFGIQLKDEAPSPESANPEDLVEFKAVGLENYWNPDTKKAEFKFFLSEQEVEVVNVTESSVTIRVPKTRRKSAGRFCASVPMPRKSATGWKRSIMPSPVWKKATCWSLPAKGMKTVRKSATGLSR